MFLLGGVWLCADALFDLMPKNQEAFRAGKYVILWLGLARVLDMMTGINAEIITYSKYYKFNMISMVSMAVLNISLSFLFLKVYNLGILSPALATLAAVSMVNIWRLIFIYQKCVPFVSVTLNPNPGKKNELEYFSSFLCDSPACPWLHNNINRRPTRWLRASSAGLWLRHVHRIINMQHQTLQVQLPRRLQRLRPTA